MRKLLLITFVMLFIANVAQAQRCYADEVTKKIIESDSDAKRRIDALDDILRNKSLLRQNNKSSSTPSVTIPIVVNVIHDNKPLGVDENITDNQVIDQINALNTYFSDYGINFCLATKIMGTAPLPSGNSIQTTMGIRHFNNSLTYHLVNPTSQQSLVALTAGAGYITKERYLQIWVVRSINGVSSGIAGYSYFPNVSPVFDGVVMRYDVFGNGTANLLPNYNLGKTLVHEIGHYLNLYHTFQGGCSGMSSLDCLISGDKVCDTPPVQSPNFSCVTGTNSCVEPVGDLPDAINNYMDYGNDNCKNSFTEGQKNRMFDVISSARALLVSSDNLIYTGVSCINPNTLTARFSASSYYSCLAGNSITFTPSLLNNSLTYLWNFGDTASGTNNTSSSQTPTHSFSSATNSPYTVTLNVSDGTQTTTFSVKIFIKSCSTISGAESTWYFSGSNALSFATGVPTVINKTFPVTLNYNGSVFIEACAQQNSSTGAVLFYTNGQKVWNDNSNDAINYNVDFLGHVSSKSGTLILPNPANVNQYYIFNFDQGYGTFNGSNANGLNGFTYSLITTSGGTSSITSINTPITIPSGYITGNNGAVVGGEGIAAMQRCDGSYWIFTTLRSTTQSFIVVYSLTTSGLSIVNPGVQIPTNTSIEYDYASSIKISPDGNKLLYVNYLINQNVVRKSYLFDFNKYTGTFGTPVELPVCYGASFSPNSRFLYMDTPTITTAPLFCNIGEIYVYQYDMSTNDIINNRKTVIKRIGNLGDMQIGPDNKIYHLNACSNGMSIIHSPNNQATQDFSNECNYTSNGILLNTNGLGGLPNFIVAKSNTAFPTSTKISITSTPQSCLSYKFFPNACGTAFNWEIKNSSAATIFTTSGTQITYTFPSAGTYTVYLKDTSNVVLATKVITITNPTLPVISGNTSICYPGNGNKNTYNSVNLLPGETVLWSVSSSGTIVGPNNQSYVQVNWPTGGGTLNATVTNSSGCSTSSSVTITGATASPSITANDDDFSSTVLYGSDYTPTEVTINDEGCGLQWWSRYRNLSIVNDGGLTGVMFDNEFLMMPPNTIAGTYWVTYRLCWEGTTICDNATVKLVLGDYTWKTSKQLNSDKISIIPNPAQHVVNIDFSLINTQEVKVEIKDINGKVVESLLRNLKKGDNSIELDVSKLADGFYYVHVFGVEINKTGKLIVKK